MKNESNNRLHPLVKLTCNGNILMEFIEESIYNDLLISQGIKRLTNNVKIVVKNEHYIVEKISIEYTGRMFGDFGIPFNFVGENDSFNCVIDISVK